MDTIKSAYFRRHFKTIRRILDDVENRLPRKEAIDFIRHVRHETTIRTETPPAERKGSIIAQHAEYLDTTTRQQEE